MPETRKYSFYYFISNRKLEIPIIQRDYAQGREAKKDLRINLLTNLKKALDGELENGEKILKMDFVYGSEENNILSPLDGQQRLTTLWLLHWYIALKAGKLAEAVSVLKNFTYETRVSSRIFCEALCKAENFEKVEGRLLDYIQNQTWFYSSWMNDPTIKSMLIMLCGAGEENNDSIEYIFRDSNFENYWDKLTCNIEKCPIIFFYLPLSEFKLTDDLYIKMNARGEHLADYENLKADLIKYIDSKSKQDEKWKAFLDPKTGFPIKFDTSWIDIFWDNRNENSSINEICFAFINRFFLDYYITSLIDDENNPLYKYFAEDEKISYTNIANYKLNNEIDFSIFTNLINILDNYAASEINFEIAAPWDKDFTFIPVYDTEEKETKKILNTSNEIIYKIKEISQLRRVVHYAVCKYFAKGKMESEANLQQWMRFVWNLVSEFDGNKPAIRSVSAMRSAINLIDEISNPHNVYEELADFDTNKFKANKDGKEKKESSLELRFVEECHKAQQIYDTANKLLRKYDGKLSEFSGKTWEDVLREVESYNVFKGYIPFVYYKDETQIDWKDFDIKWSNIKEYFTNDEMRPKYSNDCILLKTLISYFDKWDYFKDIVYDNTVQTWKNILFKEKLRPIINKLLMSNTMCNVQNFKSPLSECSILHEQLVKTNLLESIGEGHYLVDEGNKKYLHIYYDYHSNDIYLGDSVHENIILASCNTIISNQKIGNSSFFKGRDINFLYKYKEQTYYFQWQGNPNQTELDVYLMEDEWKDFKKRQNPSTDKGTDEDNFYCFMMTSDMEKNTTQFTKQLENQIATANK